MCSPPKEHVYIHMPCRDQKAVRVSGRQYSMTMGEPDSHRAMRDHFRERKIGGLDVEITLDDLEIGSQSSQEIVGVFVGQVA